MNVVNETRSWDEDWQVRWQSCREQWQFYREQWPQSRGDYSWIDVGRRRIDRGREGKVTTDDESSTRNEAT